MPRTIRRRRGVLVAALTLSMLFALPVGRASAETRVKDWVCDYRWREGTYQVKQLIRCAARRWHVPRGPVGAVAIAGCESHFDPGAYGGGNAGVFQQNLTYWPGRRRLRVPRRVGVQRPGQHHRVGPDGTPQRLGGVGLRLNRRRPAETSSAIR
jgi:hypothetical protein